MWNDMPIEGDMDVDRRAISPERAGFEEAARQGDPLNHLIYADWLEERGEEDAAGMHRLVGSIVR